MFVLSAIIARKNIVYGQGPIECYLDVHKNNNLNTVFLIHYTIQYKTMQNFIDN